MHLVMANVRRGHSVHVFASFASPTEDETVKQRTISALAAFNASSQGSLHAYSLTVDKPIPGFPLSPSRFRSWQVQKEAAIMQQMLGWKDGFMLALAHEKELPSQYDLIVRVRTDMWWVKDCPDVSKFSRVLPTLPMAYTSVRHTAALRGCIDDKMLFLPRRISAGFFNAIHYVAADVTKVGAWAGLYDFLTDLLLAEVGLPLDIYGSRHHEELEICGDGHIAPFEYAEFATGILRERDCFEQFMSDFWSGPSDFCPVGALSWTLPPGTTMCYVCSNMHTWVPGAACQECPPAHIDEVFYNVTVHHVSSIVCIGAARRCRPRTGCAACVSTGSSGM